MGRPLRFGVLLPSAAPWEQVLGFAVAVEALGFDAVWADDAPGSGAGSGAGSVPGFDAATVLAALAWRTDRLRLGWRVRCAPERSPAVVAKVGATLDRLSGGRLEVALHAGGSGPTASVVLAESVAVLQGLWTQPETTFVGRYFHTVAAHCEPKPVQVPHPPVWLESGAASAWAPELLVRVTGAEVEAALETVLADRPGATAGMWRAANLVGTPDEVVEKLAQYRKRGGAAVMLRCADGPAGTSLGLFADRVVRRFRAG